MTEANTTKSYFATDASAFMEADPEWINGQLALRVGLEHSGNEANQIQAWRTQIGILARTLRALGSMAEDWGVLIELPLLRLGRRLDTVLLIGDCIACIEFKIGATRFNSADIAQAVDYALCLRDFHAESHGKQIVPILCAERANEADCRLELGFVDDVGSCLLVNYEQLESALRCLAKFASGSQLDWRAYDAASYNPTPDIVTAARGLYAGHSVQEIGRADASGDDLKRTANRLRDIVEDSKKEKKRTICFVTGEPGSGKTLLGLELVLTGTAGRIAGEPAALLSGNRPLVFVLQEAIAEDARARLGIKAEEARRQSQQALQMLLGYLQDHAEPDSDPPEHVIVFDEAQRAWDAETGRKLLDRDSSEPELFLEILGRLPWACLVCLVGPGQEINRGESGLPLWGDALAKSGDWTVHVSEAALRGHRGLAGLFDEVGDQAFETVIQSDLHLRTNLRAYRNERHGRWVEALLAGDIGQASDIADRMDNAPALVTRDLAELKEWLKARRRGEQRVGLLSSSGAVRLIADGIPASPMSNELNEVGHWFLKPTGDFRSSNALEKPLSEFVCQGLEVDYVGVCWGNDLIWGETEWLPRKMRAPNWQIIAKEESRQHRVNAYRVLLTRGRAGVAIYVPKGDPLDPSRAPRDFDSVFKTLCAGGCRPL